MQAPPKSPERRPALDVGHDRTVGRLPYIAAIDGLRALAVLAVVLNHIEFPGMSSGFVGVDIFFAISGYLITRQVVSRQELKAPQQLREFWAGRARRIVPAMVLVIVATSVGSAIFLAPQELERVGFYGLASDLFGMNIAAAARGGNYFDGLLRESPFLHMWSLGVEEQFYVLWPLVLGPFALLGPRLLGWSKGRTLAVILAILGSASLVISVTQTSSTPLWAFYGLQARLYEFILGGAAALFWKARLGRSMERVVTVGGLMAIVAALVWTPANVGFPGAWPLLAVLGSVAMILGFTHGGGPRPYSIGALFGWSPIRWIGRYSYSWYLWHWPALVLALAATNDNQTVARIACVASIIPAALSFHVVEQRVRTAPSLMKSSGRSLAMGVVALGFGAVSTIGLVAWGRVGMSDPQNAEWVRAEESFRPDGCEVNSTLFEGDVCLGGSDAPDAPMVLLVGDSHAGHWIAAFSEAGRSGGFAVALRYSGGCPAAPLSATVAGHGTENRACASYQKQTISLMADGRIDAVIVTDSGTSRRKLGSVTDWYRGASRLVDAAADSDLPVGLLVDNPRSRDPLRCLSRGFDEEDCAIAQDQAMVDLDRYAEAENKLVRVSEVDRLDLTPITCPTDPCPLRVGETWIAARRNHLTQEFTKLQVDRIEIWVERLLSES